MPHIPKRLITAAITSRILYIFLAIVTYALFEPFDKSSLGPFQNWDSIHFTHIANTLEYEWEHFFAFFPGLPYTVGILKRILPVTSLTFIGVFATNLAHVIATFALYRYVDPKRHIQHHMRWNGPLCDLEMLETCVHYNHNGP